MKLRLIIFLILVGSAQTICAGQSAVSQGQSALLLTQATESPEIPQSPSKPGDSIGTVAPLYVDVRSWVENQVDGIEGHAHIHYPDIATEIGQYAESKEQTIYVYCAVGGRAEKARQSLMSIGYTDVVNLGGIDDVKRPSNP